MSLHPYLVRASALTVVLAAAAMLAPFLVPSLLGQSGPPSSACAVPAVPAAPPRAVARHVILVSADGLRPDAVDVLGPDGAPALHRLRAEGATTDNARTDYASTVTLPNHVTQLTGRGLAGACGHGWSGNGNPAEGQTLHANRGAYVASVFDVAHDAGHRTVAFASKQKFSLFDTSYDGEHGRADATGAGHGRDRLDRFVYESETEVLVAAFVAELRDRPFGFGFLHLRDADSKGHRFGWDLAPESAYVEAVRKVDRLVGGILAAIDADPALRGHTTVILTADHGGGERGHGDGRARANYQIPFYVWGAGAEAGADLYALNRATRLDPGRGRPSYRGALQPIRNGDAANLALDLLGLGDVPGSHINTEAAPLAVATGRAEA